MKYMGSKARLAKDILPFILENRKEEQFYVEPFVGGANLIDKVKGNRIASDNNKYLIAMWKELQKGWIPPEFITRKFYSECRLKYNKNTVPIEELHIIGYVGFNGSYGGRFYDGGYAGKIETKQGKERNYPLEAYKNVWAQIKNIKGIQFETSSYENLKIPKNSIIYCDIPYLGTKTYSSAKDFIHLDFWQWVRDKTYEGHQVFISEYQAPKDFTCIWEKKISSSLRANSTNSTSKLSVEKLFTFNK